MDWIGLVGAEWRSALVAGVVGLVSVVVTNWIAWASFRRAYRLDDRAEAVLLELLRSKKWGKRSFEELQKRVPLPDDKLQEALIRVGAVQFINGETGQPVWGLLSQHRKQVFPKG